MAKGRAAAPDEPPRPPRTWTVRSLLSSGRHLFLVLFFVLWICLDIAALGLVSQQIHQHTRDDADWPSAEYHHVIGLGLFATVFGLLFGIFHWALPHLLLGFTFFANGIFFGAVAGVLEGSPFGHGLQCGNPASSFAPQWQRELHWCSRITAIEGLAWALFALSAIGFFFVVFDKFRFVSKRSVVYDLEQGHEKIPEKH